MTLIRTINPELQASVKVNVQQAEKIKLDNGLTIYAINAGTEDVVKLELIFPSGATNDENFTAATATHQLIDSGTATKKAIDIAEGLDYYGAYLQTDFGSDWKTISLYSLSRFFNDTFGFLMEILDGALYRDDELETWKTRSIQSLKVNHEKVSWLAKSAFNEALFGFNHPYGFTSSESHFQNLKTSDLSSFFASGYPIHQAVIVISGKVNDAVINKLNERIGKQTIVPAKREKQFFPEIGQHIPVKKLIEKKDAVQSGLRIGKVMFTKNHPDYPALQITNTILGGYFGSRLMSNIREDKGYTYGIGSGLHPHLHTGYFYISTEVGNEVRDAAIGEIYFELKRLTEDLVPEAELLLVKNYLLGSFQRSIDGPFALADRFKSLRLFNLDYDYVEKYLQTLQEITPEMIRNVAATHLQPGTMTEVTAG